MNGATNRSHLNSLLLQRGTTSDEIGREDAGVRIGGAIIGVGGSASDGGLFIGPDGNSNKLALYAITSAVGITKLISEVGTSFLSAVLHRFDIKITNFNTAGGNVKVYINLATDPIIDFTGSLIISGVANLDRFRIVGGATNGFVHSSEFIIDDSTDTRSFYGVSSHAPSAAGTTNTFTTGAYTDVDEVALDDSDLISSDTNAQEFNCNLDNLPAGNFSVRGFKTTVRAGCGASGPTTLKLGINSGGTRNTVDKVLSTTLDTYERIMLVNPITGLRFTNAEIDAMQLCLKSAA